MKKFKFFILMLLVLTATCFADPTVVTSNKTFTMETLKQNGKYTATSSGRDVTGSPPEENMGWENDGYTVGTYNGTTCRWTYYYQGAVAGPANITVTFDNCNVEGYYTKPAGGVASGGSTLPYPAKYSKAYKGITGVKAIFISGTLKDPTTAMSTFYCASGSESNAVVSGDYTITTIKKNSGGSGTVVTPTPTPAPSV